MIMPNPGEAMIVRGEEQILRTNYVLQELLDSLVQGDVVLFGSGSFTAAVGTDTVTIPSDVTIIGNDVPHRTLLVEGDDDVLHRN